MFKDVKTFPELVDQACVVVVTEMLKGNLRTALWTVMSAAIEWRLEMDKVK